MKSDKPVVPEQGAVPPGPVRVDLPAPIPELRRPDRIGGARSGAAAPSGTLAAQRAALELRAGDAFQAQGDFEKAFPHYIAAMELQPQVAEHQGRVGFGYWHRGDIERAREHFQRAIAINPAYPEAHEALAQLHKESGQIELALQHARRAVELAPGHEETLVSLAYVLEAARQPDEAWRIAQQVMAGGHQSPRLAMLLARLAPRFGAEAPALQLLERVLEEPSAFKRETASLHFAAAGLLDRMRKHDEAFSHARQANTLCQANYDCSGLKAHIDQTIAYFTQEKLRTLPRSRCDSQLPVFIVGMPRSGTTLVEQILASHSCVHGAGELTWMWRISEDAAKLAGATPAQLPACLEKITSPQLDELAGRYLGGLQSLNPQARRVCDKLPANFLHLGLISLLFPNARIIHGRRDAMDTCVSCYFADFAVGNLFSSDLKSLGEYYLQYERLMAHWHSVLDVAMLTVEYEQLVRNVEGEARRMLEFLGLGWEERCLQFHQNPRPVSTLSSQQVRQPIYQSSIGRWRNYQKHLEPLRAALDYAPK